LYVRASAVQPHKMLPATGIDGPTADPVRAMRGGLPSRGPQKAPRRGSLEI